MTILAFCQERDIPSEGIALVQRGEQYPDSNMVRAVTTEIRLPADFPEKYREAVEKAAGLCTVKKNIETPPTFETYTTMASASPSG